MGNVNLGIIGDGPGWIRVICDDEAASCAKLFREPVRGCYKSIDVDVIGYYSERAVDPHPLQRGEKVRLFRVTDVIQVESVREEARIDDSDGCD